MSARKNVSILMFAAVSVLGLGVSAVCWADGHFAKKHPRRAEVLHHDRNELRRQERRDARLNGGSLTKGEKRVNAQRARDEWRDAHRAPSSTSPSPQTPSPVPSPAPAPASPSNNTVST